MKTLQEYILESLILEKRSLTSRAQKWAQKIIDNVLSDNNEVKNKFLASDVEKTMLKNISDKKDDIDKFYIDEKDKKSDIFKFQISVKEQPYDLFLILNCYSEDVINSKLNTFDFCESEGKLVYYIVLNCKDNIGDIENQKHTLAHELRHVYDKIKGHGGTKNDTYKEETINKYNKFLYYISQTEQNAFYTGFKTKFTENKENIQGQLLNVFNDYKKNKNCKNVEQFIKQFSLDCYKYRLENCFDGSDDWSKIEYPNKPKDTDNEKTKLEKTINLIRCHNPLLFLEYNYYILDTFDSFKTFISENPKKPGKEDNGRKEEILKYLKPYNDDKEINHNDENTLKKVYDEIKKFYKQTFSSYINLIKQFIKKHNNN